MFWCQPGRTLSEGMKEMKCDADSLAMIAASTQHKNLLLIIDHGDTLNNLVRDDVVVQGVPELPKVITPRKDKGKEQATSPKVATVRSKRSKRRARGLFSEGSSSGCADDDVDEEDVEPAVDSETDEDFFDSDYDVEDGDDDLFEDHVDKEVDDHRERVTTCDYETELAEDALDDPHILLSKEERDKLKYHFKAFNAEIDLNAPCF